VNCSTTAAAPASSNFDKKRTISSFTRRVSIGCTALFARHDPTKSSRRQETEDGACLRLLQTPETKGKSTSYQSFFHSTGPPKTWTIELVISLSCAPRHTLHIHIPTHTHTSHVYIHKGKQTVSRLCSRYYTLPHLNFRLLNVAICMSPPTCVRIPRCRQFMREIAKIICSGSSKLLRARRNLCE
jgi:hypothetical protein